MNTGSTLGPHTIGSSELNFSQSLVKTVNHTALTTQDRMNAISVARDTNSAINCQLWFFFGVAPLAVLAGWSAVGVCLTGNWLWELPLGLLFAIVGSMIAMASSRLRI